MKSNVIKKKAKWQSHIRELLDGDEHLLLLGDNFAHRLWQLQGLSAELALEVGDPHSVDLLIEMILIDLLITYIDFLIKWLEIL
jgi:hypothetical protein